jgi:hypothetical protein
VDETTWIHTYLFIYQIQFGDEYIFNIIQVNGYGYNHNSGVPNSEHQKFSLGALNKNIFDFFWINY